MLGTTEFLMLKMFLSIDFLQYMVNAKKYEQKPAISKHFR